MRVGELWCEEAISLSCVVWLLVYRRSLSFLLSLVSRSLEIEKRSLLRTARGVEITT